MRPSEQSGSSSRLRCPAQQESAHPLGVLVPAALELTYLVITISMSIFSVGYSSQAARPREQGERKW